MNPKAFKNKSILASAIASIMLAGGISKQSHAQEESLLLEEVLVTARKREERLIDVPMSISAVSGEAISKMNVNDIVDLADSLPNLSTTGARFYIRGQGSSGNLGFEQSVGWFVDGIYGGRSEQFRAPTFDVSSVELLRGPQGTVLGKNIIAGAINVTTARPTPEFEGYVRASYTDETEEERFEVVLSGPITEAFRARLSAMSREDDGWKENIAENAPDFGKNVGRDDDELIRLSMEWDITDKLSSYLKLEQGKFDVLGATSGELVAPPSAEAGAAFGAAFAVPYQTYPLSNKDGKVAVALSCGDPVVSQLAAGSCAYRNSDVPFVNNETDNYVLQFDYDFNGYDITFLSGWSAYDRDSHTDSDNSHLPILDNINPQEFEQFSQEIRVHSPGDSAIEWTAGLYYQDNEFKSLNGNLIYFFPTLNVDLFRQYEQNAEAVSAFGEITYNFSDNLRLIVGSRWTDEEKDFEKVGYLRSIADFEPLTGGALAFWSRLLVPISSGQSWVDEDHPNVTNGVITNSGKRSESETTFSGTLQYDWGDSQLYFNIAEGYKSGGFNEADRSVTTSEYEPENALAYELGGKFSLADGAANLNVALFYVEYDDLQVSIFESVGFQVRNAAESTSQGVELDGAWRLTEELTIGGALAYLDSKYDSYPGAACYILQRAAYLAANPGATVPCTQDLSGKDTNFAPEWSGNLYADYTTSIGNGLYLSVRGEINSTAEQIVQGDNDPQDKIDARTLVNARVAIGAEDDSWEVSLLSRNLFDQHYLVTSADLVGSSGRGGRVHNVGLGRSVTIQGLYRF